MAHAAELDVKLGYCNMTLVMSRGTEERYEQRLFASHNVWRESRCRAKA
jgi:hypothetical protein